MINSKKATIAIVVIGYNDEIRLERLFHSLNSAFYDENVDIIISIDYSENKLVRELVEGFSWKFGKKITRFFEKKQGLKKHILSCGDFLMEYDALIILEDDLIVSPCFYNYARNAVEYYKKDMRIAGISLYSPQWNYDANYPFEPQKNGKDTYFIQYAQSWGQIWLKEQWIEFKDWLNDHEDYFEGERKSYVPQNLYQWGKNSWLKYHIAYCMECDKFFVYPYDSYSTTFSEAGVHSKITLTRFQVNLMIMEKKEFIFSDLSKDSVCYDTFLESVLLKNYFERYESSNVCVDLNGKKRDFKCADKLISTQILDFEVLDEYALQLRPLEMNILMDLKGEGIWVYNLRRKKEFRESRQKQIVRKWDYFFRERFLTTEEIFPVMLKKAKTYIKYIFRL